MPLTFSGNPPFECTLIRDATADAENENVTLTLPLNAGVQWPQGALVEVSMSRDQASVCRNRLDLAIRKAERTAKKQRQSGV
jgi:hypothetical protein